MLPGSPTLRFAAALILGLAGPAWAFDHSAWDRVLKEHSKAGFVDYARLKAMPAPLASYLDSLGSVQETDYAAWSRDEKLAFWINAYNALTVKAIIDHYPIRPSWLGSVRYPKNSIRQIPGVWDKLKFRVASRQVTLDEIEHGILRKEFGEPRAHMALVCASIGCPPLRGEAYAGPKLESQLDEQARAFLGSPAKFRIDREARAVHLSPIFQWFGGDFAGRYAPADGFAGLSAAEAASLSFIARHLDEDSRRYLAAGNYSVRYLDYDWSLNDRRLP